LEFVSFLLELGEDAIEVMPVETNARGFAGELESFEESGERTGDAVEERGRFGGMVGGSRGSG
jgi:hypothetical protein